MQVTELTLEQMLADPIVRLVMRRDGVEEAELRALASRVRRRLGAPNEPQTTEPAANGSSTAAFEACVA